MGSVGTKLDEARFFYDKLKGAPEDRRAFRCYLSAFLAASRSVMQYMDKQVRGTAAQGWYDRCAQRGLVRYFKCKRDVEIHERPVEQRRVVTEHVGETIHIADQIEVKQFNSEGELIYEYESPPPEKKGKAASFSAGRSWVAWFFADRPDEDVCPLCGQYLAELAEVVDEGVQQGHVQV